LYIYSVESLVNIVIQISTHSIKMKYAFAALLAVASTASAHYTFPELVVGSTKTGQWNYVRKTANYQSNGTFPTLDLFNANPT
jgi:hypothetical protein